MKFGVIYRGNTKNIGEDIQLYATSCLLPSVDYVIDREHTDEFISDDKKAVAVIMNAWYMWAKWNWPPSKYVYPHFVGFHYADYQLERLPGTFIKDEFLQGLGGEYLKNYGPIGCSDEFTEEKLKNLGIDSYFSGCAALAVPKMEETEDKNKYICLVDIDEKISEKIRKDLENSEIEIREYTHTREKEGNRKWEETKAFIEERLTIYQNAKCVITSEFNCSMACLSMEVPVLYIEKNNDIYMNSYIDLLHSVKPKEFLKGKSRYNIINPPKNKEDYKKLREEFIKSCQNFVEKAKKTNDEPDAINKFNYSDKEVKRWRHNVMKEALDEWYIFNKDQKKEINSITKKIKEQKKKIEKINESIEK